tara:strand:+ start:89 stop:436 length:348 start_codon:yes stop_codon:yes gene_type:complete
MLDQSNIMTYYQSTLRTVGQYMLVSLGLLGYSRFYRKQRNEVYNTVFIALSLLILLTANYICFLLIQDLNTYMLSSDDDVNEIRKWTIVPKIILGINICIGLFGFMTFVREVKKL